MIDQKHIDQFKAMLEAQAVSTAPDEIAPHLTEWRDKFQGKTNLLLKPSSTEEVAKIVQYCNEHLLPIVPQGGNTGLVGGGIPGLETGRTEILLSTKRMKHQLDVNPKDYSFTADAGFTVAEIEDRALEHNRHFPLSLASEGSCTLGGILSTNAGGVHVVRYGNTRDLALGIEAVLPNGDIYSDLSPLRKDNTGYNLKHLLIGAEGTLGIITKASMKLVPIEHQKLTAWLAVENPENALEILSIIKEQYSEMLSAFELMPDNGLQMVLRHIPGTRPALKSQSAWYVLLELGSNNTILPLRNLIETTFSHMLDNGLILDAAIANSLQDRDDFWRLREAMSEAQKHEGGSIKHDISVPVGKVPEFLRTANAAIEKHYPRARPTPFGHLGDGNLHYNIMQPEGTDKAEFLENWQAMNTMVHDITVSLGGSISAEHGIGTLKKSELMRVNSPAEMAAMRAVKKALDPNGILNPGALFP